MRLGQRLRLVRRAVTAAGVFTILLAGVALRAVAEASVGLDPNGVSVAAYGGWAAWSRLDAATNSYALVVRSPRGTISLAPVVERASPFDIELGPSGSGVAAVYSRCADSRTLRGCRIAEFNVSAAAATERALAPPGGGSLHEPAIWENRVLFLRRNSTGGSEDPSHPGRKPDSLFAWDIGSPKLHSLALPVSRGSRARAWPGGLTGLITGLTFNGKQLGYATSNVVGSFGEASLWFEPLGGGPELIDQETSGAGNVCQPEFVSPVLAGRWLYAYLHACDPSGEVSFDRFTRYRRGDVERARSTFIRSGDEPISSVVPDGAGVDWANSGVQRLATIAWRKIASPVAQSFCGRADPFC